MCVIAIIDNSDRRPTEKDITAMWAQNDQGGGVAWREGGKVHWHKGLDLAEMQRYNKDLPATYILHFRIASCGDGGIPALTHPFPIEPQVSLALRGSTNGAVLFHNGHWNKWEEQSKLWLAQAAGKIKVPHGQKWSDSRTMAFWAYHYGLGIFDGTPWGINEKVIVLDADPNEEPQLFGSGWDDVDGFLVSNTYWEKKIDAYYTSAPKSILPGIREIESPARTKPTLVDTRVASLEGGGPAAVHPFLQAKYDFEDALGAFHTKTGSKNALKRARKELEKMTLRYPDVAKYWRDRDAEEMIARAEARLSAKENPPTSPPQPSPSSTTGPVH